MACKKTRINSRMGWMKDKVEDLRANGNFWHGGQIQPGINLSVFAEQHLRSN